MSHFSSADERFGFLEIAGTAPPVSGFSVPEIPANQHLNYLDLLALRPTPTLLRQISRRLMEKYRFVPITTTPASLPLRLPKHLDPQFHWHWKPESNQICYIAMCPPEKELILQFIHNAVGHGLHALPIKAETFERFMTEKYLQLKKG